MFSPFSILLTSDIVFSLAGYSILAKTVAKFMTAALTAQSYLVKRINTYNISAIYKFLNYILFFFQDIAFVIAVC